MLNAELQGGFAFMACGVAIVAAGAVGYCSSLISEKDDKSDKSKKLIAAGTGVVTVGAAMAEKGRRMANDQKQKDMSYEELKRKNEIISEVALKYVAPHVK